jgi:hypothetical protein
MAERVFVFRNYGYISGSIGLMYFWLFASTIWTIEAMPLDINFASVNGS